METPPPANVIDNGEKTNDQQEAGYTSGPNKRNNPTVEIPDIRVDIPGDMETQKPAANGIDNCAKTNEPKNTDTGGIKTECIFDNMTLYFECRINKDFAHWVETVYSLNW